MTSIARRSNVKLDLLEARRLLSTYWIDTDSQLAAVNAMTLLPGDQVLLRSGQTFHGSLLLDHEDGGNEDSPVLISTYNLQTRLPIDRNAAPADRATVLSGDDAGIIIYNTAGIEITALNFIGTGPGANHAAGIGCYNDLPGDKTLSHLVIDRVDVGGYHDYGIALGGLAGKSGFSDVRITRSDLHDNGDGGLITYGTTSGIGNGYAHHNVYVAQINSFNNFGLANSTKNSGNGIVLGDVDEAQILHCVVYNNGSLNTAVGGPVGIWAYEANRVLIQWNESYHNHTNSAADGGGFDLDGGITNSVMQHNYSHENDGAGFGLFQYVDARPWHDNVVRFNLSINDGRNHGYGGISFYTAGSPLLHADVYDNTVVIDWSPSDNIPAAVAILSGGLQGVRLMNNNLVTSGSAKLISVSMSQDLNELLFLGNNYYSFDRFTIEWHQSNYHSLNDWRRSEGQETLAGKATGLSVDPMFVNGSGLHWDDFQLRRGSTLVGRGLDLSMLFGLNVGDRDGLYQPIAGGVTPGVGTDWYGRA